MTSIIWLPKIDSEKAGYDRCEGCNGESHGDHKVWGWVWEKFNSPPQFRVWMMKFSLCFVKCCGSTEVSSPSPFSQPYCCPYVEIWELPLGTFYPWRTPESEMLRETGRDPQGRMLIMIGIHLRSKAQRVLSEAWNGEREAPRRPWRRPEEGQEPREWRSSIWPGRLKLLGNWVVTKEVGRELQQTVSLVLLGSTRRGFLNLALGLLRIWNCVTVCHAWKDHVRRFFYAVHIHPQGQFMFW